MRFLLVPPNNTRPSLIVETHEQVTELEEQRLSADMYKISCANGILFDNTNCVVLRDALDDMGPQSVRVDLRLQTSAVLSLVRGSSLNERVQTWLSLLSVSWNHAIPTDEAVASLIYDVVPAAAGTSIHIVEAR